MPKQIRRFRMRTRLSLLAILALAASGQTASALSINLTYASDATFTAAGLTATDIVNMKAACTFAATQFTTKYNDPINVNIMVTATPGTKDLGSSNTFFGPVDSYAALQAAVAADSSSADDATSVGAGGSLRAGADPIATNHVYSVTSAQAKALGLLPDDMQNDGTFSFGGGNSFTYDPNNRVVPGSFDFIGVAMHEYSEIMGRNSLMGNDLGMGTPIYAEYDLFSYTAAGVRGLNKGPGRFFSFDAGTKFVKAFNDETANMGDDQDWAGSVPDSFNAFGPPGELAPLTAVDLQAMDIVGYNFGTGGPATIKLANISTRGTVQPDPNALIGGFIVTGTQPKKVILRAIGPSLGNANPPVVGALADPSLELHDGTGAVLAMNDNWMDLSAADQQVLTDNGVAPTDPMESALVATLPANTARYTAIVRGVNNTSGIGLVEAYDIDNTVDSKLANISTRGLVQPDPNALIGGFIVTGAGTESVIVRAIGPSLANANPPVVGALADPILELHDGNGALLAMNDNWRDLSAADQLTLTNNGVAPTDDAESALVATLPPGKNTAIVRGVNGTSGVALVEVYGIGVGAGP